MQNADLLTFITGQVAGSASSALNLRAPTFPTGNVLGHKRRQPVSNRKAIFPADRHALYEAHGYSAAIRSGDLLFVSGQVGSRPDGSPEPEFAKQVDLAFRNLDSVLAAAGATFDDIIDVTSFHTDPEAQFETIMPVKNRFFPAAPHPTWTAVGVNWLAGFDFEIKVIARARRGHG